MAEGCGIPCQSRPVSECICTCSAAVVLVSTDDVVPFSAGVVVLVSTPSLVVFLVFVPCYFLVVELDLDWPNVCLL
jgi:hypothetical protein